jgi:hypothetical protein
VSNDFVLRVEETLKLLETNPYLGHPYSKAGLRELLVTRHCVLIYRVKKTTIEIALLWETRLDPMEKAKAIGKKKKTD